MGKKPFTDEYIKNNFVDLVLKSTNLMWDVRNNVELENAHHDCAKEQDVFTPEMGLAIFAAMLDGSKHEDLLNTMKDQERKFTESRKSRSVWQSVKSTFSAEYEHVDVNSPFAVIAGAIVSLLFESEQKFLDFEYTKERHSAKRALKCLGRTHQKDLQDRIKYVEHNIPDISLFVRKDKEQVVQDDAEEKMVQYFMKYIKNKQMLWRFVCKGQKVEYRFKPKTMPKSSPEDVERYKLIHDTLFAECKIHHGAQ